MTETYVTLSEIAAEVGVSVASVHNKARHMGFAITKRVWNAKRHSTVSASSAAQLRAAYAARLVRQEDAAHWMSVHEAARALGLSVTAFHQRRATGSVPLDVRYLHGKGTMGRQARYNPAQVSQIASQIGVRFRSVPRGMYTTAELTRAAQVDRSTARKWFRRGCPRAGQTVRGNCYWKPDEVAAWLRSSSDIRARVTGAILLAHLQQTRAA